MKQPPEVFWKKGVFKIHRKTPVPEFFFDKVAGLRPNLLLRSTFKIKINDIAANTRLKVLYW